MLVVVTCQADVGQEWRVVETRLFEKRSHLKSCVVSRLTAVKRMVVWVNTSLTGERHWRFVETRHGHQLTQSARNISSALFERSQNFLMHWHNVTNAIFSNILRQICRLKSCWADESSIDNLAWLLRRHKRFRLVQKADLSKRLPDFERLRNVCKVRATRGSGRYAYELWFLVENVGIKRNIIQTNRNYCLLMWTE